MPKSWMPKRIVWRSKLHLTQDAIADQISSWSVIDGEREWGPSLVNSFRPLPPLPRCAATLEFVIPSEAEGPAVSLSGTAKVPGRSPLGSVSPSTYTADPSASLGMTNLRVAATLAVVEVDGKKPAQQQPTPFRLPASSSTHAASPRGFFSCWLRVTSVHSGHTIDSGIWSAVCVTAQYSASNRPLAGIQR
jgi:hypothetical protein